MKRNIVIYQDDGVGEFGVGCLLKFFAKDDVRLCDAADVKDGSVLKSCDVFVMPGGADLPYCRKLNGRGNQNIHAFVEDGGFYLGLCAGAYYACKALEFHTGRPDQIAGPRELALLDAVAYGSLPDIAPYYDLTLESAGLAKIALPEGGMIEVFYHGGPAFHVGPDIRVLARYADLKGMPPAVIAGNFGKGRVVLCGVHPEMNADLLPAFPAKTKEEEILRETLVQNLSKRNFDTANFLWALINSERVTI